MSVPIHDLLGGRKLRGTFLTSPRGDLIKESQHFLSPVTKLGTLPGVNALPTRTAMPDVMVMNDGRGVTERRKWDGARIFYCS